jgi:SAM-dependent methyltransferase
MQHSLSAPEPWVVRFAPLVPAGTPVLDLACGEGRHVRFFQALDHPVTALDRNISGIPDLTDAEVIEADVENGPWPLSGRRFGGIVVVNYLHRPLLPVLAASLTPGGVLIYRTFAVGNERFGRPRNPDFLLRPGELLDAFRDLTVVAYEHGEVPGPAVIQQICAVNEAATPPQLRASER